MPPNPSHDGTTEGGPARAGQCNERSDGNDQDQGLILVKTGRYIKRCVHPFASVSNILVVALENLNPGGNPEGVLLSEEGIRRYTEYSEKAMEFCPRLKALLEQHGEIPSDISEALQRGMRTARSSDAHTLKGIAGRLASTTRTPLELSLDSKSDRGFNHDDLGRMIIPIDYLEAYNLDPADVVEKINDVDEEYRVTAELMPAFLYDDPDFYNPDDLLEGLMRGYFLVRCFRAIFLGAGSAMEEPSTTTKSVRVGLVKKYGMTTVTVPSLVYTAARFSISSQQTWSCKEGPFDYDAFSETLFGLFEVDKNWTQETISWWNLHVFGHRNGIASRRRPLKGDRESSPLTQPPGEVPRDEEEVPSSHHRTTPAATRGPEENGDGGRLGEDSEEDVPARQSRKRRSREHSEDEGAGDENDSGQGLPGARQPQPRAAKRSNLAK
ncbi:hypothetical protein EDB84DRAFT_1567627 [Lactarius hengduanensis]|nr:hypothetical protein EDB84DRAFT_1567627 [Lactarius hengduanensis]